MAGYLAGTAKKCNSPICASDDLRQRAGEFQRGGVQSRTFAQSFDGGNCEALRDIQAHEPVRDAGGMTIPESGVSQIAAPHDKYNGIVHRRCVDLLLMG